MENGLIPYGVPSLVLVVSLPMALGMVPPNQWYGFRTPETLSSPELWYAANRAAGRFMATAALVSLAFNLALSLSFPEWAPDRIMPWMVGGNLVPLAIAVIASYRYLRRL